MLKLVLNGDPVSQARMRMFRRGNKTLVYDPQGALKKHFKDEIIEQMEDHPHWKKPEHPRVMFWFYMPIPKNMGRTERALAHQGFLKHTKKPDVDNLIKLYLDVVSGIVFDDDNCVSLGSAIKVYSLNPRTEIYIEETDKILTMDEVYEGTWPTMKDHQIH